MPEWVGQYKSALITTVGVLLIGAVIAISLIDKRDGIAIAGTNAGFSAQEIKSWSNVELLNSPDVYNRKNLAASEVCPNLRPRSKNAKVDCAAARKEVEQNMFNKLAVQSWAQAQSEKDGIKITSSRISISEKALLAQLITQTHSSTLEEALRKSGLSRSEIRHRAETTAAFNAQLPAVPAPPNNRQIQNTYNKIKKTLTLGPAGSLRVWQYTDQAKAQAAASLLRSGSNPSRPADIELKGVPYNTAKSLPAPWGDFIQRQQGVFMISCSIRWCAGIVYPATPAKPAPALSQIAAQIRDNMIFEVRNMQIQDLGTRLAKEWGNQTSCSGLSVCS